ncbi:hypothetical protein MAY76_14945 [Edwardsiella ictaluri]|nr:hypothetical protein [Edwardsiella ictaluri]WFO11481.1 hypothetical protein MAY76_14945 [Edwardsiella ictaluri]WFO14391.1 hypothetical protein MAY82_15005 [Edwardsiella ictaluri]
MGSTGMGSNTTATAEIYK